MDFFTHLNPLYTLSGFVVGALVGMTGVGGNGGGGNGGGGNGGCGNGCGGNGGGGRGFNNPEFTSCLSKNGVTINQGERPDMQDPKVQAAVEKCRSLLPQGGNFGNRQQQGQATTSTPNG